MSPPHPAHPASCALFSVLAAVTLVAACSSQEGRRASPEVVVADAVSDAERTNDRDGKGPVLELRDAAGGGEDVVASFDAAEQGAATGDEGADAGEADVEPDDGSADDVPSDTGDAAAEDGTLLLWTFNLLNPSNPLASGADVHKRTGIVVDAIRAAQPDLVAFQEVVQSGSVPNRARFIAEATGYRWEWHQTYSVLLYDEGIAVLSRHPILETRTRKLPHKDLVLFERYVLGARVETPAGEVDFYCTHMTAGGSESESADQAVEAWSFVSAESEGVPAFLAGDLNAEPDTPAMRFLRGEESRDGKTGDLADLWLATRPEDPGFTISPGNPHDRIDYIYATPAAMERYEPVDCRLIFDERVDAAFASDHIGVECELRQVP